MKQIRQMILFLVLIALCGGYAFWKSGLYFSPEGAMHAQERGLRYGPSKEILLVYEKENGHSVYVGRLERGLSVVCVEPKGDMLWKTSELKSGYGHCLAMGEGVEAYPIDESRIVGLSSLPEVTEVTCYLNVWSRQFHEYLFLQEVAMDVANDGFFYGKVKVPEEEWEYCSINYLEGRTAAGEVVFQHGEKKKLAAYPSGKGYIIQDLAREH